MRANGLMWWQRQPRLTTGAAPECFCTITNNKGEGSPIEKPGRKRQPNSKSVGKRKVILEAGVNRRKLGSSDPLGSPAADVRTARSVEAFAAAWPETGRRLRDPCNDRAGSRQRCDCAAADCKSGARTTRKAEKNDWLTWNACQTHVGPRVLLRTGFPGCAITLRHNNSRALIARPHALPRLMLRGRDLHTPRWAAHSSHQASTVVDVE